MVEIKLVEVKSLFPAAAWCRAAGTQWDPSFFNDNSSKQVRESGEVNRNQKKTHLKYY